MKKMKTDTILSRKNTPKNLEELQMFYKGKDNTGFLRPKTALQKYVWDIIDYCPAFRRYYQKEGEFPIFIKIISDENFSQIVTTEMAENLKNLGLF